MKRHWVAILAALSVVFLAVAPAGWSPQAVFLRDDGIDVRICPHPGKTIVDSYRHPDFVLTAAHGSSPGAYPKSGSRSKQRAGTKGKPRKA